ncbi:hypothetical protein Golob_014560, partial [Gossypium lobatum]|nr:hypothetical protein [Gossypium lobatum]
MVGDQICELPIIPNRPTDRILPKILFVWRLSHDLLLKNVQISSIKQSFGKGCLKCSGGDETAFHALKECTKACAILALRGINGSLLKRVHERCIDWLEEAMHLLDKNVFKDLITILWNLLNSRKNAIF